MFKCIMCWKGLTNNVLLPADLKTSKTLTTKEKLDISENYVTATRIVPAPVNLIGNIAMAKPLCQNTHKKNTMVNQQNPPL